MRNTKCGIYPRRVFDIVGSQIVSKMHLASAHWIHWFTNSPTDSHAPLAKSETGILKDRDFPGYRGSAAMGTALVWNPYRIYI